ncbi:Hint domain-containing protein [Gluconobacter sp. Dm-62]|uniref:Hint domain-containing protein n=1 Tax=Gluconobacter sp. Dm-62 TaxID=2799804 RepID=UPI001B8B11E4|nr:Hint domain-containing protein [Gluconobacter sp. Dm-62]MBS1103820.1 Hint domain-containing protein [Gluconobacter sp. Dm-62]
MTSYSDANATYTVTQSGFLGLTNTVTIQDNSGTTLYTLSGVPSGNIITGSSSVNVLASLLSGTYVSVPGSTGDINILLNALSSVNFYIGGDTTVSLGVSAVSGLTMNVVGGQLTFSSGLLASALQGSTINISEGGTYVSGSNLASVLTGSTISFGAGGGTLILNGGGTLINLSGTSITNYNPAKDTIELQNTVTEISGYTVSGTGSSRTVTLFGGNNNTQIATYTVTLASGATLAAGTYNALSASNNPLKITYSNGNTYIGVCFLADSMIRTPSGETPIQDLRTGDEVLAWHEGAPSARKVIWTGRRQTTTNPALPDDQAGYPVRVLANAIAENVPHKDMLITAEHCLFMNGRFIPARMLVNGHSIFYDRSLTSYEYFHIETRDHAVIMADGMLTESYLDTGNRHTFRQDGKILAIGGQHKTWADAAAPLEVSRDFVEPLYRQIESRAIQQQLPPAAEGIHALQTTEDPDLHLVASDGQIIRPMRQVKDRTLFMIPPGITSVTLMSHASRPCDTIGPFVDDRRNLGVLVGDIVFFDSGTTTDIETHLEHQPLEGWSGPENTRCRWTTGNAVIPLGERAPLHFGVLSITILATGTYFLDGAIAQETIALRA